MQRFTSGLVSVVLAGCLAGLAAADTTWTGEGDGSSWSDPANWGGTPPGGQRRAFINGTATVNIDAAVNDTVNRVILADGANEDNVTVNMTGGSLTIAGGDDVENLEVATLGRATFHLSGGMVDVANYLRIGTDPPPAAPVGEVIVDGGTLTVGRRLIVGFGPSSNATLRVGGTGVITADQLFLADGPGSNGQMFMTGGTVNAGAIWIPTNADAVGATAHLQLDAGTINTDDFRLTNVLADNTSGTVDITLGKIIIPGDLTGDPTLLGYISDGVLTGFGGSGSVVLTYIDGVGTEVSAIPEPATLLLLGIGVAVLGRQRARR